MAPCIRVLKKDQRLDDFNEDCFLDIICKARDIAAEVDMTRYAIMHGLQPKFSTCNRIIALPQI